MLVPEPVDILFVEYNANGNFTCDFRAHQMYRQGCLEFELLLRKLLQLPGSPVVVLLDVLLPPSHPTTGKLTFQGLADSGIELLADYYSVPYLSMKSALWHLQRSGIPGFAAKDTRLQDTWHLNPLGHDYAADIAMHYFWHGSEVMDRYDTATSGEDQSRYGVLDDAQLFPPLQAGLEDVPSTWVCTLSDGMMNAPGVSFSPRSGNWTFDADDKWHLKYGFITQLSRSSIDISWKPSQQYLSSSHSNSQLMVMVGFLRSYAPIMSSANVTCAKGCQCMPAIAQSFHHNKVSVNEFVVLPLARPTGFDECIISVTVLDNPRERVAKFKIIGCVVVEEPDHLAKLGLGRLRMFVGT
jgi:hypothetical protein